MILTNMGSGLLIVAYQQAQTPLILKYTFSIFYIFLL